MQDRNIPKVTTKLCWRDHLGAIKARWAMRRMRYTVKPGLYAIGNPTADSPVLVSANYKLSFDKLRKELTSLDAWIIVLDTKGINVWCAAGKGTFGTEELLRRIKLTQLDKIVNHHQIIVPQLGAVGVAAHEVKKQSGFSISYGPIHACDIIPFIQAGMKATPQMRKITFPLWDRTVLIPVELVMGFKHALFIAAAFFLLAGFSRQGYSTSTALSAGPPCVIMVFAAFLASVVLGPILLPWLPGKAFALKGLWIGIAVIAAGYAANLFEKLSNIPSVIAWLLLIPALTSFALMNFTGTSTYTSLSGVKREMQIAIPIQLLCTVTAIALWITGRFI
ncbi:MAG: acetyl-CoA synthase subunit gamma [Planctomycetes bacterium]|nr:acetyl-CoA synthase subunit gamma [Planctomycetota bacterium]